MKNITLAIDDEVLRAARIYAAEHDTTVNALVREFLAQFSREREARGQGSQGTCKDVKRVHGPHGIMEMEPG
jgi:plasmid stability protein